MADRDDQQPDEGSQPNPAEGEAAFGAAFAERSADPAGQASRAQQDEGDKSSSSTKEPAEAGSEAAPAEAATSESTSGTAKEADPWEGLTPEQLRERLKELQTERDRLQASERSNRGRVGALTKKLNALSTATPAPTAAPKQEEQGGKATEGGSEGKEVTASDLDKRLQAVTDEYGEVVGPVVEALKEARAEIESLKKAPALQDEIDSDAETITAALGELEKVHPDYQTIAADENFTAWLGDQPAKVIELANSFDPREVSLALTLFKTERSAALAQQPGENGDQGDKGSTATDDKRKRQLEGSRQVPGSGQPAAAGVPNDFSSAFKARAEAPKA